MILTIIIEIKQEESMIKEEVKEPEMEETSLEKLKLIDELQKSLHILNVLNLQYCTKIEKIKAS